MVTFEQEDSTEIIQFSIEETVNVYHLASFKNKL